MVQKGFSEMINGVWRIKWWKYRYVLLAALVLNVVLINHFFFDSSISGLNPFQTPPPALDEEISSPYSTPNVALPPTTPKPAAPTSNIDQISPKPAETSIISAEVVEPPPSSSTFNLHDYDFNGEYVGWPLARACNETTYTPGLVFVCDNNSGGIGNIRNFILTCIRYAIDAGATGVIMPRIQRRSEEDLANIFTTGFQPFDYFFDENHFRNSMSTYCPKLVVYDSAEDIPNSKSKIEIVEFYPKDLNIDLDGCDGRGVNRHLDMFRTKFDEWLEKTRRTPNATVPVTIRFKWATFFEWPVYRDGPEFATTFGDILRINKDIEEIAAATLTEMSRYVGVEPDPTNSSPLHAPYLGIHLRTESDALGFWPNYDEQIEGYLKHAARHNLKYAYIGGGSVNDTEKFVQQSWEMQKLNVTSKTDLLKGEDLERLNSLTWDQQALVDFLVLTKSTHFTGCSFSSFTMNIAYKRHLMLDGIHTRQWRSPGDVYSSLVGRFESWYGDWMFMYECMWP